MTKQQKSKTGEKKKAALKTSMKKKPPPNKTTKQAPGKTKGPAKLKKTSSQSTAKPKGVLAKKSNVKKVTKPTKTAVSSSASKSKTTTATVKHVIKVKATVKTTSKEQTKNTKGKGKARSESIKQALQLIKEASKNASKQKSAPITKLVTPAKSSTVSKPKVPKTKTVPVKSVKNAKSPGKKLKTETKVKSSKKVVGSKTVGKSPKQKQIKPKITSKQGKLTDKNQTKATKRTEVVRKQETTDNKTKAKKQDVKKESPKVITKKKAADLKSQKESKPTKQSEDKQTTTKRKAESVTVQKDVPAKKRATEIKSKAKKQTTLKAALAKRKVAIENAKMIQKSPRQRKPKVFHDFLVFTDKGAPEKKMMDSEKKVKTDQHKRKAEKSSPQASAKKIKKSDERVENANKASKPNSENKENKQIKTQPKTVPNKKTAEREKLTKVKNKENKKTVTPKTKQTPEKKTATPKKNGKKVIQIQDEDPNELKMKAILACERKVQWKDDKSPCWITGIAALPTGQTLIADMSNKKIKLLDSEYNLVAVQSLPSCPQAISTSPHDKNSAYFTMPFEKCGIQKITATKGDCLEITEKINTAGTTRGITCTKEGIITSVDSQVAGDNYQEGFRIDIMNYKGKVLKSIQDSDLLKLPLYLAASNSRDIIIANCRKGSPSIVKMDKRGTVDYKYEGETNSKLSIEPRGITTDEDHNVYVSEWRSNYVYILSPSGRRSKILLRGEDIMTVGSFFSRPYQLCYTKAEGKPRKLIVSFESWDRIKIFNIVKFQQS